MRRAGPAVETAEDLSAHYRTDKWAFSTPLCDVYAGEDLRLHRDVHLRFFTPRVMRDSSVANAVLAAAKQAAAVVHPNLVAIYDIGTIGGRMCVVTEAAGPRLSDRTEPLTDDEATALAQDWVEGLRAAHAAGVVHGDISGEALVASADGTGKVADVGLTPATTRHGTQEGDFRALAVVLRQHGATQAAERVLSEAPAPFTQVTETQTMPPVIDDPSSIPPRPTDDPSPQPIPVATTTEAPPPEPAKPNKRARPRLPQGAAARFAPLVAVVAFVIGMLVVAFNDDPPPIPGLPDGGVGHHTNLPSQIPR